MTRQVLKDVLALLERQHHKPSPQWLIAADKHGNRARPVSPDAVTFSVLGAICRVAAGQTLTSAEPYADLTEAGDEALELVKNAALYFGYPALAEVDRAGVHEALRVVKAALHDYKPPEPRRHLHAVGTGSNPKGAE
jgi:hypothetical protein